MISEMGGWLQMQDRQTWLREMAHRANSGSVGDSAPRRRTWRRTVRRAA